MFRVEALQGKACTLEGVRQPQGRLRLKVFVLLGVAVPGNEGLQMGCSKKE
jgi:hypothetical protein